MLTPNGDAQFRLVNISHFASSFPFPLQRSEKNQTPVKSKQRAEFYDFILNTLLLGNVHEVDSKQVFFSLRRIE